MPTETTDPIAAAREEGRQKGLSEAYNLVAELVWQGDKSRKDDPEIVGDILDALGKIAPTQLKGSAETHG